MLATLSCLTASPIDAQDVSRPLVTPGVSAELAAFRRGQLRDVRYDLSLTVSAGDTAAGRVSASFIRRGTGDVILDFRGLALGEAVVNGTPWPEAPRY